MTIRDFTDSSKPFQKADEFARKHRDSMDKGHSDNREGLREHELPYWNNKLRLRQKLPVAENYHDRTPKQKAIADEERLEHESRRRHNLKDDE